MRSRANPVCDRGNRAERESEKFPGDFRTRLLLRAESGKAQSDGIAGAVASGFETDYGSSSDGVARRGGAIRMASRYAKGKRVR